jgi:hypothetical protein
MRGVRDLSGVCLNGYLLLENRLGASSHTAVYRATTSGAGEWAVKVIDRELEPQPSLSERIEREAGLLAAVDHPDILPIQGSGLSEAVTFAATPLLRARTLRSMIQRGELDDEAAWRILAQIADALDSVHHRGLVCRVLKPANILVDDASRVHLAEYGLGSRRVGPLAMSIPDYRLHAPQYLAPEQVEGKEPDWRADVYAMAVLAFELLTHTPLHGETSLTEILTATLLDAPPSALSREPDLPAAVDQVLARAMAKDPRERQRSVWELLDQLVSLPDEAASRRPRRLGAPIRPAPTRPPERDRATAGPAAPAPDSAVALLGRMGMPALHGRERVFLDSYFATVMRHARTVCAVRWPQVLRMAGLLAYVEEGPPGGEARTAPVEALSRLADAVESVLGQRAPELTRLWGVLATGEWLETQRRPGRARRPEQAAEETLRILTQGLDRVRGERLHLWRRVDHDQLWLMICDGLMVVGRRKAVRSCHFWTAAVETTLRWGGVPDDWVVEEVECGCVTGTFDCVFTVQRKTLGQGSRAVERRL